jgi:hypothetical protein
LLRRNQFIGQWLMNKARTIGAAEHSREPELATTPSC